MIDIRPFSIADEQSLSCIYLSCRLETFYWLPQQNLKLTDFNKDTEGERILVIEADSKLVGFISIWMQDNFIHHLFIESLHQGKGFGKLLLAEALKIIGRPARLKCVVQNSRACQFYEKQGWIIESTTPDDPISPYHTYRI